MVRPLPILAAEAERPLTAGDHDANLLALSGFDSLAAMLADTTRGYAYHVPGDVVVAVSEGFRYRVAPAEASDHHLTTAAGLKLYVLPGLGGVYNFRSFAPAANGTTDDYSKLMMALNLDPVSGRDKLEIYFPPGNYRLNSPVQINKPVICRGLYEQSIWTFANGISGVTINNVNTRDGSAIPRAEAIAAGMTSGAGTVLDGIYISGQQNPSARGTTDGLWLRARATISRCSVRQFSRYAIRITSWSEEAKPDDPELWGDADGYWLEHVRGWWAGTSVFHVRGDRASGTIFVGDATYGGHWGFDVHTPEGTTVSMIGCHAATSGVGPATGNPPDRSSMVHFGGRRYRAVLVMDENGDCTQEQLQKLVVTEPGTDAAVWVHNGNGGSHTWYPTWTPGKPVGTYFPGGGYRFTGDGFMQTIGCYGESDDPGALYWADHMIDLGGIKERFASPSRQWTVGGGGSLSGPRFETGAEGHRLTLGEDLSAGAMLTVEHPNDSAPWRLRWRERDIVFDHDEKNLGFRVVGRDTTDPDIAPFTFHVNTLAPGDDAHARRRTYMPAAPTSGAWAKGDIVWNSSPSAGGTACWVCTESGTPGTWKAALAIAA